MISIIHPYYNNINTFNYQHSQWSNFSNYAKQNTEIIVVDDGSPDFPCKVPKCINGVDLKILRIEDNILWNTAGAANLGITEAKYDWIFHIDMDKGVSSKNIDKFLNLDFSNPLIQYWPELAYTTTSKHGHAKLKAIGPHCNSYLMNKNTFWKTGGYDEDFGGYYGYQDSMLQYDCKKLNLIVKELSLNDGYLDVIRNCPDSHCDVDRITPNRKKWERKICGVIKRNYKILNFKWHQVYPEKN